MDQKTFESNVLLVGFDNAYGDDVAVLVVGRKRKNQSVEILNAFQGQEAVELYEKLSNNPKLAKAMLKEENGND